MKRVLGVILFMGFSSGLFAQNEIDSAGNKLIWILLIALVVFILIFLFFKIRKPVRTLKLGSLIKIRRVKIKLTKDKLYYPNYLTMKVKNTGNLDIDLDRPLLVFDNFWLKRNFRIKGMNNRAFYPLYLEKRKEHTLEIDLNQFYRHDKRLKRYPKIKIKLFDVKNRRLGSESIFIRKTLIKF